MKAAAPGAIKANEQRGIYSASRNLDSNFRC